MRWAFLLLLACAACDDTESKDGARGSCAVGGALSGCEDSERTAEAACWRLVECGSLPLEAPEMEANAPDFGNCLQYLERMAAERAELVIACVASSTCDELQAPNSPNPYRYPACFDYGAQ